MFCPSPGHHPTHVCISNFLFVWFGLSVALSSLNNTNVSCSTSKNLHQELDNIWLCVSVRKKTHCVDRVTVKGINDMWLLKWKSCCHICVACYVLNKTNVKCQLWKSSKTIFGKKGNFLLIALQSNQFEREVCCLLWHSFFYYFNFHQEKSSYKLLYSMYLCLERCLRNTYFVFLQSLWSQHHSKKETGRNLQTHI